MPYGIAIDEFSGLDLRQDPGETPGALDLLNVTLLPGRVRSRFGSVLLKSLAATPVFMVRHPRTGSSDQLLVASQGTPGVIQALDAVGGVAASDASKTWINPCSSVHIGTTTAEFTYIASGHLGATMLRWDGTAFTYPALPALLGSSNAISYSPADNRLAVAGGSTVCFSDPGAPETFTANNFVTLVPGDGEGIAGMAVYRNQLFVFKRTKFFVFYGNSADSAGQPIFNYRPVDVGRGVSDGASKPCAIAVGEDGVYFVASDGVYRTTGGEPQKISAPLDPFFAYAAADASTYSLIGARTPSSQATRMHWFDGTLYVSFQTSGTSHIMFTYVTATGAWSAWNFGTGAQVPVASMSKSLSAVDERRIVVAFGAGTVVRLDPTLAADNGAAIVSRYRGGFHSYGFIRRRISHDQTNIRATLLEGTGTPTLQWSRDWGVLQAGSSVSLTPTNLVTNPSFEVDTAGWATGVGVLSAGGTLTRSTAEFFVGAASMKIDTTANGQGAGYIFSGTFLAGVKYQVMARAKSSVAENFRVSIIGSEVVSQDIVLVANTWTQFAFSWTPTANSVNPQVDVQSIGGATTTRTIYVDAVLVAAAPAAVAYFDGSTAGYAWTGTAHASTSYGSAPGYGHQRLATRGRAFSFQVGAASGAWSVNRVTPIIIGDLRPPEITV